ncbi:hypothetical protein D3C73_983450 [compost metagenome]
MLPVASIAANFTFCSLLLMSLVTAGNAACTLAWASIRIIATWVSASALPNLPIQASAVPFPAAKLAVANLRAAARYLKSGSFKAANK